MDGGHIDPTDHIGHREQVIVHSTSDSEHLTIPQG